MAKKPLVLVVSRGGVHEAQSAAGQWSTSGYALSKMCLRRLPISKPVASRDRTALIASMIDCVKLDCLALDELERTPRLSEVPDLRLSPQP